MDKAVYSGSTETLRLCDACWTFQVQDLGFGQRRFVLPSQEVPFADIPMRISRIMQPDDTCRYVSTVGP